MNVKREKVAVRTRRAGGEERRVGEDSDESGRGDHPYRLPTTSVSFHAEIILESTK